MLMSPSSLYINISVNVKNLFRIFVKDYLASFAFLRYTIGKGGGILWQLEIRLIQQSVDDLAHFPEFFRIVETGHEDYLALFIDNDISGDSGSLGSKGVKGFTFGV